MGFRNLGIEGGAAETRSKQGGDPMGQVKELNFFSRMPRQGLRRTSERASQQLYSVFGLVLPERSATSRSRLG
jgi:hypothetical protein